MDPTQSAQQVMPRNQEISSASTITKLPSEDDRHSFDALLERKRALRKVSMWGVRTPYEHLAGADQFRIFALRPGSRDDPLRGKLQQPLRVSAGLTYDALSYRWSEVNTAEPSYVEIDDVRLPIGPELHAALVQFRKEEVMRWLWIDQICIDQSDEVERIQQVKIMADIYSRAQKVLIWLGSPSDRSDVAMEFFPIFIERVRRIEETAMMQQPVQAPSNVIEKDGVLSAALSHLFERPWFQRVWTLQEAAMAKTAEVWCGKKSFSFELLETFARCCDNDKYGHWLRALDLITPPLRETDAENPHKPYNSHLYIVSKLKTPTVKSASLLNAIRSLDCSQDDDRIYAVLHFLDSGLVNEISPKKKPSTAELYHHATIYGIRQGDLDYLGAAGLSQQRQTYQTTQNTRNQPCLLLPSWVPDWTYWIRTHSYWVHNRHSITKTGSPLFLAGGRNVPDAQWRFSGGRQILNAVGVIVDEIEECTIPFRVVRVPEGMNEESIGARQVVQEGFTGFQSYIASCMKLAADCSWHYGPMNIRRLCRQSLVGGMMPVTSNMSAKSRLIRSADEAVNSLFEDFETSVWIFNEGNALADEARSLIGTGNDAWRNAKDDNWMDDNQARFAEVQKARERIGDVSAKNNLIEAMAEACKGRRFFTTRDKRYMGMAPDISVPGDRICVLQGCCAPFAIRPKGSRYQLIGECFVAGIMDGEIMESKEYPLRTISFE